MNKNYLARFNNNNGEVSLIYVFIVLTIVIVSAFSISAITINTIKGANVAEYSARAQTAADTYLEKALFDFNWAPVTGPLCDNFVSPRLPDGTQVTVIVDDGIIKTDGSTGACPSISDVTAKNASLCVYAFAENHGVQKKLFAGAGKEIPGCPVR